MGKGDRSQRTPVRAVVRFRVAETAERRQRRVHMDEDGRAQGQAGDRDADVRADVYAVQPG